MKSSKKLVLCGVAACIFGCSAPPAFDPGSSSSSGSGGSGDAGSDAGSDASDCEWGLTVDGMTIPTCTERFKSILQGTVDGQPYDETFGGVQFSFIPSGPGTPPYRAFVFLPAFAQEHIEWLCPESEIHRQYCPVTGGSFRVPGENVDRPMVTEGSWVRAGCYPTDQLAMILNFEGGHLAICAVQ